MFIVKSSSFFYIHGNKVSDFTAFFVHHFSFVFFWFETLKLTHNLILILIFFFKQVAWISILSCFFYYINSGFLLSFGYSMQLGMWVEINTMEQKQASTSGRQRLWINMNSAYLKCGLFLVHLATISTPLKLVGRYGCSLPCEFLCFFLL